MTPIMQFASTLATYVRFEVPQLCFSMVELYTELATKLKPFHHHLSQDLIEPVEEGNCQICFNFHPKQVTLSNYTSV